MAELVFLTTTSLDGFVADEAGDFGYTTPDEEVHRFVNDLAREVGTFLFGRRMYEVMTYWETAVADSDVEADFTRVWQQADKVVYSRTLAAPASARTRIEREFDPVAVQRLKDSADRALGIGGSKLAGQAVSAGLVDELQVFVVPHVVGGGTPLLPRGTRASLRLVEERRFDNGTVFLRYRTTSVG